MMFIKHAPPADTILFLSFPLQNNFSISVFIILDLVAAYGMVDHSLFFATLLFTQLSGEPTLFLLAGGPWGTGTGFLLINPIS